MKNDLMISVVIPVYNVEKFLDRCIKSILDQTYSNLEIILVDDGSTDHSGEICDKYQIADNRVRVIHKKNGGLSDARNVGIDIASGEYIAFVDGDDFVHPEMYDILLSNLIRTNSDLACCEMYNYEETQENLNRDIENKCTVVVGQQIVQQLERLDVVTVSACNKLYKRELFDNCRYPIGRLHEDQWVIHRILFQTRRMVKTEAKLYYYVVRNNSITKTKITEKRIFDLLEALEEQYIFFKSYGMFQLQKNIAYHVANYVLYYYRTVGHEKMDEKEYIRKRLRLEFEKIMKENDNVFSWKQVSYRMFMFQPWLGIWCRWFIGKVSFK